MTKEQTIKHLKLMQSGARNAIRFSKNDKKISEEERKEDIEIYQDQLEALDMAIKALEQQPSDCKIFGHKEKCIGGANCENCDYKIQKLEQPSDDCVSREDVKQFVEYIQSIKDSHNTKGTPINFGTICDLVIRGWKLMDLPPVTPTHGTCKDCKYSSVHTISLDKIDEIRVCRIQFSKQVKDDYYCGDYEKRGDENEIRN